MKDKIEEKLKTRRIQQMKSPVIFNKDDFEEFKNEIEFKVCNLEDGGKPKYKNIPLNPSRNLLRGGIFIYENAVTNL